AIDAIIDLVVLEFRDTAKLHRLAGDIAELSPVVMESVVVSIIDGIEHKHDQRVTTITEKIFDMVILPIRISLEQARRISDHLFDAAITPERLRLTTIDVLNSQNIAALEESVKAHATGFYRLLARLIGVRRVCYEWRRFLETEPDKARAMFADLMERFS